MKFKSREKCIIYAEAQNYEIYANSFKSFRIKIYLMEEADIF